MKGRNLTSPTHPRRRTARRVRKKDCGVKKKARRKKMRGTEDCKGEGRRMKGVYVVGLRRENLQSPSKNEQSRSQKGSGLKKTGARYEI